jgi:hypothetical protein
MTPLRLHDIANVLDTYRNDFGFLDVFADNVAEIAQQERVFRNMGDDIFRTQVDGTALELRMFRDRNIARFQLVRDNPNIWGGVVVGAMAGAALGGATDADNRRQAPAGVIFGLLLGGLLGGVVGATTTSKQPRQVLTLWYDSDEHES